MITHSTQDTLSHYIKANPDAFDFKKLFNDSDTGVKPSEDLLEYLHLTEQWDKLSQISNMPIDFIRKIKSKINWAHISSHGPITPEFIEEFHNELHWHNLLKSFNVTEDILRRNAHHLNDISIWHLISIRPDLSVSFIRDYKEYIRWGCLPDKIITDVDFCREFGDYNLYPWLHISHIYHDLPIEFIREFKDKIFWFFVPYENVSLETLREFKEYVDWEEVPLNFCNPYKKEGMEYCKEFRDVLPWNQISKSVTITDEFVTEFYKELSWSRLKYRYNGAKYRHFVLVCMKAMARNCICKLKNILNV